MKTAEKILYDLRFGFEPKIDQLIIMAIEEYANLKVKEALDNQIKDFNPIKNNTQWNNICEKFNIEVADKETIFVTASQFFDWLKKNYKAPNPKDK